MRLQESRLSPRKKIEEADAHHQFAHQKETHDRCPDFEYEHRSHRPPLARPCSAQGAAQRRLTANKKHPEESSKAHPCLPAAGSCR